MEYDKRAEDRHTALLLYQFSCHEMLARCVEATTKTCAQLLELHTENIFGNLTDSSNNATTLLFNKELTESHVSITVCMCV